MRWSRRAFLGASLAPMIVPGRVFGAGTPSKKLQVAIIGSGDRGRSHAVEFKNTCEDRVRVVAVCDANAENTALAKELVDRMNGDASCAVYRDFREVLMRPEVDAVLIAVPDHWHAAIAIAAARAGKPMYSEKPLAYSVAQGQAMVRAVRDAGVVFQHGTQQRSWPQFRQACMLARNGRLGRLHTVRVGAPYGKQGGSTAPAAPPAGLDYEFWLGPAPQKPYTAGRCDGRNGEGWYHIRDYSGGWITAWGSHDVDIAHWGAGLDDTGPVKIEGRADFPAEGAYDTAWRWHVELDYANGVRVIYATENEHPHGIRFEGDEGWVFVNRGKLEASSMRLLKETFGGNDVQLADAEEHHVNFVDAVTAGAPVTAPIEAAHRSTAACHLAHIAVRLGRPLRWDPAAERFLDDAEADAMLNPPMRAPWGLA